MLKTVALPFIAVMLIFSILAPSLVPLIGEDYEMAVLWDTGEEEKNSDNESEKKLGEKDLFLNKPHFSSTDFSQNEPEKFVCYFFSYSVFEADILLPPPEEMA